MPAKTDDEEVEDKVQDKAQFHWLNAPAHAEHRDDGMFAPTGAETDFWRETYYGFWHDNGHIFHSTVEGDLTAEVTVDGRYETLYDQAGLMARLGEANWAKPVSNIRMASHISRSSSPTTNPIGRCSKPRPRLPGNDCV
jgi:regulation of enolase protein 1 (concanavalin A-like superfamily)